MVDVGCNDDKDILVDAAINLKIVNHQCSYGKNPYNKVKSTTSLAFWFKEGHNCCVQPIVPVQKLHACVKQEFSLSRKNQNPSWPPFPSHKWALSFKASALQSLILCTFNFAWKGPSTICQFCLILTFNKLHPPHNCTPLISKRNGMVLIPKWMGFEQDTQETRTEFVHPQFHAFIKAWYPQWWIIFSIMIVECIDDLMHIMKWLVESCWRWEGD